MLDMVFDEEIETMIRLILLTPRNIVLNLELIRWPVEHVFVRVKTKMDT